MTEYQRGDVVWTRFGSHGRQPAQIVGIGRYWMTRGLLRYRAYRFRMKSGRWTGLQVLVPDDILGRYDGPPLPPRKGGDRP